MQPQFAVGTRRRASSVQSCGDKLNDTGGCEGKDTELGERAADSPTTSQPSSSVANRSLVRLMERTGYSIVQQNGQRRYGPPPDWNAMQPPRGCEVFVGKIPRDCFEDELVPVFERFGRIYEMRLMMDYNGMNRGYAFVVYTKASDAKECVRALNNWEIRKGRTLGICMSIDNCRLFVGGIPKKVNKDDIRSEMEKVTEGVVDIIVYPSASDKTKNRGFAFIEYESHRAAAMARRKLMQGRVQLWGHQIAVDWAEPELEVPEEVMAQVKVLYVRNLMLSSTESTIEAAFAHFAPVERVKKIRDYAFVHFHTREGALLAKRNLNGSVLDGAVIEVTLAKPVDKDSYPRSPRQGQQHYGIIVPMDCAQLVQTAVCPGYYPKYIPRNSMGARVIRNPRTVKGRGRNLCPVFGPPLVFPASPVQGPYIPQCFDSPKRAQTSEEPCLDLIPGVDLSPAATNQAAVSAPMTAIASPFIKKSPIALLEELCVKNSWGPPTYTIHSVSQFPDGYHYYQYKVFIPALRLTFLSAQSSHNHEEGQSLSAEVALAALGFPLEGARYATAQATPPPPLSEALAVTFAPTLVAVPNAPSAATKHICTPAAPAWPDPNNIFTGYVQPSADVYRRGF